MGALGRGGGAGSFMGSKSGMALESSGSFPSNEFISVSAIHNDGGKLLSTLNTCTNLW